MYSELECGICYRNYNAGRRCPRELQCKHSFCGSCLLALSRPHGPEEARLGAARLIVCPLCRHTTSISGEGKLRTELRVNECVLEQVLAAEVQGEQEEDPEEEKEEEEGDGQVQHGCDDGEEATLQAEESDSSAGSNEGRLRRSWRKFLRKINGKKTRQRRRENCITSDDMRNFAMMSCYMF